MRGRVPEVVMSGRFPSVDGVEFLLGRGRAGRFGGRPRDCRRLPSPQHKQRCPVLEDQLVDLVVYAMERSETEEQFDDGGTSQLLWQHLSSQLIFFVLFQFASFPHMVLSLHQKVLPPPPTATQPPSEMRS